MNTPRIGDSSEQTRTHRPLLRLSVALRVCLLVLATAMPAARGQQEIPLDVSPEMLSGSLEFYASPSGLTFATPLPYGVGNNLNDYGWIWQDGSHLTVAFPSPVALSRIRVYCVYDGGERGAQWVVEHSSNNASWVHAADFTYYECFGCGVDDDGVPMTGTGGWYSIRFNEAGETDRYWRLRQTQTLNGHAPRSGEMEFYGILEPLPTNSAPWLIVQPVSQTVSLCYNVRFRVSAWGTAPLSYQWRFNGTALPAATTNTLTLNAVQEVDAGEYDVVVTNNYGSVTSQVAVLTVSLGPPPGALYVVERYNGNVAAIDTTTGEGQVIASGLGAMVGAAVDRRGRLFVTRFDARAVAIVDPVAHTFRNIATGIGVDAMSADPDEDILYVGAYQEPVVYQLRELTPDNWVVKVVVSGLSSPVHALRDGTRLYVTDAGSGTLYVKDLITEVLTQVVDGLGSCDVIERQADGHLIVGSEVDVYRVNPSTKQIVRVYSDLSGPNSVVLDPADPTYAYVNEQYGGRISRLNLVTGQRTTVSTFVNTPWQMALIKKFALPLSLNVPVLSGNTLTLTWDGGPGIKLQKSTTLTHPNWQVVSGSEGLSQIELPCTDAAAFFRLIKP